MMSSHDPEKILVEKVNLSENDVKVSFVPAREPSAAGVAGEACGQQGNREFDRLLHSVGATGRWQWWLLVLLSCNGIPFALHSLASAVVGWLTGALDRASGIHSCFPGLHTVVKMKAATFSLSRCNRGFSTASTFIAATPEHWCHVAALDSINGSYDLRNGSVPWEVGWEGKGKYSSCLYYDRNWTGLVASGLREEDLPLLPTADVPTRPCHEWVYDHSIYETTAVEEWNLVCENKYRMSLIQSTFMGGALVGAVVISELSDKFGRRTMSLISALGFLIFSVSIAFVHQYSLFLTFRGLVAAFGCGLFLSSFVILMESVGPEGRTVMGMLYQCFFSVGFMLIPGIAYLVNEWRSLQLCISIPSVLLLLYYWLLPESPRWLMMQGRYKEALKILRQVAKTNGRALPPEEELDTIVDAIEKERKGKLEEEEESLLRKFFNIFKSAVTLLSTPNMRRRCLIIFFAWFVVSMVYYGLAFSGGNINASPYLLVFLSGVVEIPSYSLSCWTLKRFGRRLNLFALFIICGAACLLILAVPKDMVWFNTTLATVGKFFNAAAFGVVFIYSAELVPTGVRNIAVGTSSMCAKIGSALAPFIVDLLGDLHYAVPSTVFGLLSVAAGLLALLLPETSNTNLPESVEEVEALLR